MSEDKPRSGDRVRVMPHPYEGTLHCDGSQGRLIQVRDDDGMLHAFGPNHGIVELIEPADDPSKDPLDTVRISPNGAVAIRMHVFRDGNRYTPGWRLTRGSVEMHDRGVVGWQKAGPVPGTPLATEARAEVEHTNEFPPDDPELSMAVRQSVAELLTRRDEIGAIRAVQAANCGMTTEEARALVRAMPEYQTGLNLRPVKDIPLHVDNEAIVQGQYYAEKARARRGEVSS